MKKSWDRRAEKVIAQGCNTYSKRSNQYVKGVYPTHVCMGHNAHLLSTDSKEYIDFVCGLGANLIDVKNSYSLPSYMEVELAEKIVKLFVCIDKLKILKTGSEGCQAAVRIARAYKENIFSSPHGTKGIGCSYNGWHNWCIAALEPGAGTHSEGFKKVKNINQIISLIEEFPCSYGYVIIEPIMLDMGKAHIGRLKKLRQLCTKRGIVLIFDEVITGFRTPKYCMANYLDIQPDIIVLGKAMANGHPIAIVGGKKKFVDTPDYFISSTFAGETTSIRHALRTLEFLNESKLETLWRNGKWFQREFNKLTPKLKLVGLPTRATWEGDETFKALFWQECCKCGILFGRAWFVTFSHTRALLKDVLTTVSIIVKLINKGKVKLEGEMPKEVFSRY